MEWLDSIYTETLDGNAVNVFVKQWSEGPRRSNAFWWKKPVVNVYVVTTISAFEHWCSIIETQQLKASTSVEEQLALIGNAQKHLNVICFALIAMQKYTIASDTRMVWELDF